MDEVVTRVEQQHLGLTAELVSLPVQITHHFLGAHRGQFPVKCMSIQSISNARICLISGSLFD